MFTAPQLWSANMFGFILFSTLLAIGFFFGRMNEVKHFKALQKREAELSHITVTNTRQIPDGMGTSEFAHSMFVSGNTVVSVDYFKRIVAGLRGLIGGRINSYTSLVERARREAVVRMKTKAAEQGMIHISNLRIETASVYPNAKTGIGSIEVYAYGTALK